MECRNRVRRAEPGAAMPTKTTMTQSVRRVCVNIEANGSKTHTVKSSLTKRRKREAAVISPQRHYCKSTTYLPSCPAYEPEINEPIAYALSDLYTKRSLRRLSSGQDLTCKCNNLTAAMSSSDSSLHDAPSPNRQGRPKISVFPIRGNEMTNETLRELRSVINSLEKGYRNQRHNPESRRSRSCEHPTTRNEPANSQYTCPRQAKEQQPQLNVLADLMRETITKLNYYMTLQAERPHSSCPRRRGSQRKLQQQRQFAPQDQMVHLDPHQIQLIQQRQLSRQLEEQRREEQVRYLEQQLQLEQQLYAEQQIQDQQQQALQQEQRQLSQCQSCRQSDYRSRTELPLCKECQSTATWNRSQQQQQQQQLGLCPLHQLPLEANQMQVLQQRQLNRQLEIQRQEEQLRQLEQQLQMEQQMREQQLEEQQQCQQHQLDHCPNLEQHMRDEQQQFYQQEQEQLGRKCGCPHEQGQLQQQRQYEEQQQYQQYRPSTPKLPPHKRLMRLITGGRDVPQMLPLPVLPAQPLVRADSCTETRLGYLPRPSKRLFEKRKSKLLAKPAYSSISGELQSGRGRSTSGSAQVTGQTPLAVSSAPSTRDCGTTMWCPMACCSLHGGLDMTEAPMATPDDIQSEETMTPPPPPTAPASSAQTKSSAVQTLKKFIPSLLQKHRKPGGVVSQPNLSFGHVDNETVELSIEGGEEGEDNACYPNELENIAEELEQECYSESNKSSRTTTQMQDSIDDCTQTSNGDSSLSGESSDSDSSDEVESPSSTTSTIRVTTEKAISTSDSFDTPQTALVGVGGRDYKSSALKTDRKPNPSNAKVQFEATATTAAARTIAGPKGKFRVLKSLSEALPNSCTPPAETMRSNRTGHDVKFKRLVTEIRRSRDLLMPPKPKPKPALRKKPAKDFEDRPYNNSEVKLCQLNGPYPTCWS